MRLRRDLDPSQKLILYNSFVISSFGYCPVVWMYCGKSANDNINRIQKRALRALYNDFTSSYNELLNKGNHERIHIKIQNHYWLKYTSHCTMNLQVSCAICSQGKLAITICALMIYWNFLQHPPLHMVWILLLTVEVFHGTKSLIVSKNLKIYHLLKTNWKFLTTSLVTVKYVFNDSMRKPLFVSLCF